MRYLLAILLAATVHAETIVTYDSRFDARPDTTYPVVDSASVEAATAWKGRGYDVRGAPVTYCLMSERACVAITGTIEQAEADFRLARAKVSEVTPRQFKLALLGAGITPDNVESALSTITNDIVRIAAQIEWREASVFKRSHPLVAQVGLLLSADEKMIDELFLAAEEIE